MDHTAMRQFNSTRTLQALFQTTPMTMSELQAECRLSRRTLELIVDDLIELGWVDEAAAEDQATRPVGRPARTFGFKFDAANIVAIELEAGQINATVANLEATKIAEVHVNTPIPTGREERLSQLSLCIDRLLAEAGISRDSILAVTVSSPGIVKDDGTVDLPMTMPEWTGFSLSEAVGRLFNCPVSVENDAKLAALGEKWSRDGHVEDFVYIHADSDRIGVGLVIRNELHRGHDGAAGEVSWADALGFHDLRSPLIAGLGAADHPAHEEANRIVAQARRGEAHALTKIDQLAEALAPGITSLAWILAPEEIILGGSLSAIDDLLLPSLERALSHNRRPIQAKLLSSPHVDDLVLRGCLRMCIESLRSVLFSEDDLPRPPRRISTSHRGVEIASTQPTPHVSEDMNESVDDLID